MAEKKISTRTCIACRKEAGKGELLRVVRTPEGSVLIDKKGKASGRGAYVCNDIKCIEKAIKTKGLSRALKIEIPPETVEELKGECHGNE